jgi:hypothetical protein
MEKSPHDLFQLDRATSLPTTRHPFSALRCIAMKNGTAPEPPNRRRFEKEFGHPSTGWGREAGSLLLGVRSWLFDPQEPTTKNQQPDP